MKAVIPAAGLGTRFLPATKSQPKEMLPIVDKPALHYVVEEAVEAKLTAILLIIGRSKQAIVDYFDKGGELPPHLDEEQKAALDEIDNLLENAHFYFVRQERPLGLGHAVLCSRKFVGDETFAVLLGDDIIVDECVTGTLMKLHEKYGTSIVAVEEMEEERLSDYGVVSGEEIDEGIFKIDQMVEKPKAGEAPSDRAMVGRYVLTSEIYRCLDNTGPGLKGEIQLTDAMMFLNKKEDIHAYRIKGRRMDIGTRKGWMAANIELALRKDAYREEILKLLKELTPS